MGDTAAEYPLGDPAVEITFGVPVGVRRGVIYGVKENLCPEYLEAIEAKWQRTKGYYHACHIKFKTPAIPFFLIIDSSHYTLIEPIF